MWTWICLRNHREKHRPNRRNVNAKLTEGRQFYSQDCKERVMCSYKTIEKVNRERAYSHLRGFCNKFQVNSLEF